MSVNDQPFFMQAIDDALIIRLQGEIDYLNLAKLQSLLSHAPGELPIIVSLEYATYLDSVILHALIEAGERIRRNRRAFYIIYPKNQTLMRLLSITAIEKKITFADSISGALEQMRLETA